MDKPISGRIEKKKSSAKKDKYQNLDTSALLEKIDDDIQKLNQLKTRLKQQDAAKDDTEEEEEELKERKEKTVEKLSNSAKVDESPQRQHPKDDTWKDNSKSVLMNGVDPDQYRRYELAYDRVKEFYHDQHTKQTVAYNIQARINFKTKVRDRMPVWDALLKLNKLLDESDPDTEMSQIDHALQTAEAIRRDNKPRWFQCVGLIHDLGKLLYFYDARGQWDVVGDTFPVGCRFSKRNIYYEYFKGNPDYKNPLYNTKYGIYSPHCGLKNVMLSWGHDEYMYNLAKEQSTLPAEGLAMIRYHSFYPWHREGAYKYLMSKNDEKILKIVQTFNPYDLYSKTDIVYDINELKPYYIDLINEFFPNKIVAF